MEYNFDTEYISFDLYTFRHKKSTYYYISACFN